MYYVYQLKSLSEPKQRYTGYTQNLKARLAKHNNAEIPHTSKFTPWKLVNYIAFSDELKAKEFETYLKSGSGRSFANRHFW